MTPFGERLRALREARGLLFSLGSLTFLSLFPGAVGLGDFSLNLFLLSRLTGRFFFGESRRLCFFSLFGGELFG